MQIRRFTRERRTILLSLMCYYLHAFNIYIFIHISNGFFNFFSIFFVVSGMAHGKDTWFLLNKFLSHWQPDHLQMRKLERVRKNLNYHYSSYLSLVLFVSVRFSFHLSLCSLIFAVEIRALGSNLRTLQVLVLISSKISHHLFQSSHSPWSMTRTTSHRWTWPALVQTYSHHYQIPGSGVDES